MKVSTEVEYEIAQRTLEVFELFLEVQPHLPRFALLAPHILFHGSLLKCGHILARNDAAHKLVELWTNMTHDLKLKDDPTYAMLRTCIERLGIPFDHITPEDLGMKVQLMSRGGDA